MRIVLVSFRSSKRKSFPSAVRFTDCYSLHSLSLLTRIVVITASWSSWTLSISWDSWHWCPFNISCSFYWPTRRTLLIVHYAILSLHHPAFHYIYRSWLNLCISNAPLFWGRSDFTRCSLDSKRKTTDCSTQSGFILFSFFFFNSDNFFTSLVSGPSNWASHKITPDIIYSCPAILWLVGVW